MVDVYKALEIIGFVKEFRIMPKAPKGFVNSHSRQWRFDWAHVPSKTAIEFEGGTFTGGRHTRPIGYAKDAEKYNYATREAWRVFRYTYQMVEKKPFTFWAQIIDSVYAQSYSNH